MDGEVSNSSFEGWTLLFDEIEECCTAMQKSDAPTTNAVAWLFKKGRTHKLQKHLEALKTTLVVMKTVLHHGKEYGTEKYVFASALVIGVRKIGADIIQ